IDLLDRRMDRIDRDIPDRKIFVVIELGRNVAAAALEPHLDIQRARTVDGGDVNIIGKHLDIRIGLDIGAGHLAAALFADGERFGPAAVQHERNLFEIEDYVGGILNYALNGRKLMLHALDLYCRNRRTLDRRQERPPYRIADRRAETAFKGLCIELSVSVR